MIGRRVVVYGPAGAGKTTVARRIGRLLSLPVVELDELYWQPNWEPTPSDEFRTKAVTTLERHTAGWVCDGNYAMLRDAVLPMADTVVWLRPPFRVAYWRLLKRTVSGLFTKEALWGTNYPSWRMTFLSKESLLLYGVMHWKLHFSGVAADLAEIPHEATIIQLRSTGEVERFFAVSEAPT